MCARWVDVSARHDSLPRPAQRLRPPDGRDVVDDFRISVPADANGAAVKRADADGPRLLVAELD